MHLALLILTLLAAEQQRVAVLEFDASKAGSDIDRTYFSDKVRGAVHKAAPQLLMMTRESTVQLLKAQGKKLENCEGECEVETGRMLGADYVISGRITKVGTRYLLTLRLHRTASGDLLETSEARGKSLDELVDSAGDAALELVKPLAPTAPAPPPAAVAPAPPQAIAPPAAVAAPGECAPEECYSKAEELIPKGTATLSREERKRVMAAVDWRRVKELYRKACDGRVGMACVELGNLRLKDADREGALELFRRACDHSAEDWAKSCDAVQMVGFGLGYNSGEQSAPFFKVACDGGNATACSFLASFYLNGRGVPENPTISRTLYRRACELGDKDICNSSLVK